MHRRQMLIRYKLFCNDDQTAWGIPPTSVYETAACYDLAVPCDYTIAGGACFELSLNIGFEPEPGHHIEMHPRSSTLIKRGLIVPVSIIDWDYRGPVRIIGYNTNNHPVKIEKGTRLVQIKAVESIPQAYVQVREMSSTLRGNKGTGSSGK